MLRLINVGTWEDRLDLERMADRDLLSDVLAGASAGAMTASAWSLWHYRLGLIGLDDIHRSRRRGPYRDPVPYPAEDAAGHTTRVVARQTLWPPT